MLNISKDNIYYIYDRLLLLASESEANNNDLLALDYIAASARWAYFLNFIYSDSKAENLIKNIASKNITQYNVCADNINCDNIVFVDTEGIDNRGLTQQYIRAFIKLNYNLLYIYVSDNISKIPDILKELDEYPRSTVLLFNNKKLSYIEKANVIAQKITAFKSKNVFLHLMPWDVTTLLAINNINGITKYNINLTDHAYWLGSSFLDYNLEFRTYGSIVSREKRNIPFEKQLFLPFYPIKSKFTHFNGFPDLPNDSIIVFTGGAEYKMLGNNDIFFRLMDIVLSINPKVFILVAGVSENSIFVEKLNSMKYGDRVRIIGVRRDIDEVFENCDIYLGTYPTCGGLMTQFAAQHSKAIIAYHAPKDYMNTVEELVNHYSSHLKSFDSIDSFRLYAEKVINDKEFRLMEGKANKESLMTEDKFVKELNYILQKEHNINLFSNYDIDYDSFFDYYYDLENTKLHSARISLWRSLRFKILFLFPRCFVLMIDVLLFVFCNFIKRKFNFWGSK